MPAHYSTDERHALERRLAAGRSDCPRCGAPLEQRAVPPRPDVYYVRDRVWLLCGGCGATAVLERGRIERARGAASGPDGEPRRGSDPKLDS